MWRRKAQNRTSLRQHLIRGASGSLLLKACNSGLALLLAVVLARLLGTEGFGIYALCLSTVEILAMLAMLGGHQLLVREVASYQSRGMSGHLCGLLKRFAQASALCSLALSMVGALTAFLVFRDSALFGPFLLAMALLPLLTCMQLQGAALRGLRHIVLGSLAQNVRPAMVLLLLGGVWFTGSSLQVWSAMAAQVAGSALLMLATLLFLFWALPRGVKKAQPEYETSRWFKSVLPFVFVGVMQILNRELAVVLLGILQNAEEVGLFRVAQRGALLIPFGLQAVNMAIAPTVARMFAEGEKERLQRVIHKSILAILAYALPVALILILGGKTLLALVFGEAFVPAYAPLVLLCVGQLINVCTGSVGVVLNMAGMERYTATGVALAVLVVAILCLILIPLWGSVGAAVASSAGLLVWNLLLFVWVYRKTGLVSTLHPRSLFFWGSS